MKKVGNFINNNPQKLNMKLINLSSLKEKIKKSRVKMKDYYESRAKATKRFYSKMKPENKERLNNLVSIFLFALEYGILINIILIGVFNYNATIQSVFGWGLLWYFIQYEVRKTYEIWKGER